MSDLKKRPSQDQQDESDTKRQKRVGAVRVGRIVHGKSGHQRHEPSFPGFTPIVVMTASSKYGAIGPYVLRDEQGRIMENVWQFSKLYERVPASTQRASRYDRKVIWQHPAEVHYDQKTKAILPAYWKWRAKGMNNPFPIRYPVGFEARHSNIVGSLVSDQPPPSAILGYIEARKQIYVPLYRRLVKQQKMFQALKRRLQQGENLLILEVDGPHAESLPYYQETYGVDEHFIQGDTVLMNERAVEILLNDPKHPFGHGYCLGMELLDL